MQPRHNAYEPPENGPAYEPYNPNAYEQAPYDPASDDPYAYETYEQRKKWERQEKREHFRMAAGVMEFLGVVLGVVSILVLLALLFSLLSWLGQDISSTFAILRTRFQ